MLLKEKIAVIAGDSSGKGRANAEGIVQQDAKVAGTDTGRGYLDMIPVRRWGEPEEFDGVYLRI